MNLRDFIKVGARAFAVQTMAVLGGRAPIFVNPDLSKVASTLECTLDEADN